MDEKYFLPDMKQDLKFNPSVLNRFNLNFQITKFTYSNKFYKPKKGKNNVKINEEILFNVNDICCISYYRNSSE